jgi:uncharacterized repeat protein (TIGR01451 family)
MGGYNMSKRIHTAATIAFCLLGLARIASAQDDSTKFRPFGGFFADMFGDDTNRQPPHALQHNVNPNPDYSVPNYSTAGGRSPSTPAQAQSPTLAPPPLDVPPPDPVPSSDVKAAPKRAATNDNYSFQWNDHSSSNPPSQAPLATGEPNPSGLPMYERLKQFRDSPFSDSAEAVPSTPDTPSVARRDPPATGSGVETSPGRSDSLSAPPSLDGPLSAPPSVAAQQSVHIGPQPMAASQPPAGSEPRPLAPAAPSAEVAQEPSVLIDHKSPQLSVETIGPRKIAVGKEAAYEVVLQNSGEQAAEEVAVTVGLPDWADVAGASASTGEVAAAAADHSVPCRWTLRRVEAHSKEKLTLRIIPRQSKPFELAVHWDFKQAPSQALIEVQEPKLAMRLDGPREVLFGKKEMYQLKLSNGGNGPAENVTLTLLPLSGGDTQPVAHRLGTIPAGDQRTIEVELTARQPGKVVIRVEANGDGGAHVDLAESVLVHRGALQVEVEGPAVQFVGTPAGYTVAVRNPGDAPARNVKVTAKLPTGTKFLSGSDGAAADNAADGGRVHWTLERLEPGERRILQMKCALALSGLNRLEIASAAEDDLAASATAVTRVEATADLRLEIKEPDGPVPVGAEAVYELHIRNRGTKAAENVEVLSYFSHGVEPFFATGQSNHITPGQVVFDMVPAIAPATELVLTIKAKADLAGNHVFRAEVHCKSAGTRLVREETTRYYQDSPGQQTALAGNGGETSRDDRRTAERQAPLPLPQTSDQPLLTPALKR